MALDFLALQTEVYARGFDYLEATPTRVARWINDGMHEIDSQDDWLYLQTVTTGTVPLVLDDLDTIQAVYDSTDQFEFSAGDLASLAEQYGDISLVGMPQYYYLTSGNTLNTYPVSNADVTVYYYKVSPDLSIDADTPLMPDRFRQSIVEYACAKAYLDSDNPEMAAQCRSEGDRIIQLMRDSQTDVQQFVVVRNMDGL